jgi:hypothetical protein
MFQMMVNRNYTTGFPGEFYMMGPHRGKMARIMSATLGADPGMSTNRISRAFGWSGEQGAVGDVAAGSMYSTYAAMEEQVEVGAPTFFGILGNPKRYALMGTSSGGPLAASLDLPMGYEGEFYDMATGFIAELFNEQTAIKTENYGDQVAYVPNNILAADNTLALPYGALISVPAGSAVPTGMILIPNARVTNPSTLAASALGSVVSGYTIIQLTQ